MAIIREVRVEVVNKMTKLIIAKIAMAIVMVISIYARSNSLIEVLERVFSSTFLTMTAQ